MKKLLSLATAIVAFTSLALGQSFTESSTLLPGNYFSGGVTGVADVDHDGLDDIIVMNQSKVLNILFQQPNGTFVGNLYGQVSGSNQWGMAVGDFDNNGFLDVFSGGAYDGIHYFKINSTTSGNLLNYGAGIFMQGCNFADINNDGWLDAFACHDDGPSFIMKNDGAGNMIDGNELINMSVYPNSDNSGNYGSVWTDFDRDGDIDLFVAKCRQFVSNPSDPRRTNLFMVNESIGFFDQAGPRGLINFQQTWTVDFADIDNDGDFDCFMNTHSGGMMLFENDGTGNYTNISGQSGVGLISGFLLQGKLEDLDNDGFVDIVYSGGVSGILKNNGNKTFSMIGSPLSSSANLHSFGLGDLNNDGFIDAYACYGSSYVTPSANADRLYLNNGNSNHWVSFDLTGVESNKRAVGALVEIHGSWGVQLREVRAGESYGINNSFKCHFGIGASETIDYAVIHWPAGHVQTILNPEIDMVHNVVEDICDSPAIAITASGNTTICLGESVTLSFENPYGTSLWSNGETTETIVVTEPGIYTLVATDDNGCSSTSNSIEVIVNEEPTPSISALGNLEFCAGFTVQLTASDAPGYLWSNGETTQTITVSEPGNYSVRAQGACLSANSNTIEVVVHPNAPTPAVVDTYIIPGDAATLVATGEYVEWFVQETDVVPLAIGNDYNTPPLTSNTTYYIEASNVFGGDVASGGLVDVNDAMGAYFHSNNRCMYFNTNSDCVLRSVKVDAGSGGMRAFEVRDANGAVVAFTMRSLVQGQQIVDLSFALPAGSQWSLWCTTADPDLWREFNTNVAYPYPFAVADIATITGTNVVGPQSNNYYYMFYDWQFEVPTMYCSSDRVAVNVYMIQGCNDPAACNYNPGDEFDVDCTYAGCTNAAACNYNSNAGCDDGSCVFFEGPPPAIIVTYDNPNCNGTTATLSVDGNNFVEFLWSNGETAPSIDVAIEGEFSATLIDANGCVVNASPVSINLNPLGVDEICYVDYNADSGEVFIHWNASQREGITSYNIYRDNSGNGIYQWIANVEETVSSFNDPQLLSFDLPLSYQVSIFDTCGVEGPRSAVHAPIRMRAVSNGFVQLNWTPYQGAEIGGYTIQRREFGTVPFTTIATVDANTTMYMDNSETGNFEYMITATGSTCGELFLLDNLHSNIEFAAITSVVENGLPAASIYPNPSSNNEVFVQVDSGWIGARVNVVDALGKTISSNVIRNGKQLLELNHAEAGVYFVILTAENGNTKTLRLIKE